MGNWCGAGTFGRVYTAEELQSNQFFPDNSVWQTQAGQVDGKRMRQAFISRQVGDKQASLFILILIYFLLSLFIYLGVSVIPDYAPIPQTSGVFSVPHSIWGIWPFVTIFVFQATFYFGSYFQVSRVVMGARAFYAVLVIDILVHIAHLVLVIVELANCQSLLCTCVNTTVGKGFLIALAAVEGVFVIWQIIVFVVASSFVRMITEGLRAGWMPGKIQSRSQANVVLTGVPGESSNSVNFVDEMDFAAPEEPEEPDEFENAVDDDTESVQMRLRRPLLANRTRGAYVSRLLKRE
jgi:hypothetical protein